METTTRPHELIPTGELLEELFARYETALFAGHSPWVPEAGLEKIRINWRGNLRTALAMAARLGHQINLKLDDCEADAVEEGGR
jgi:hypothetical protein